MYIHGNSWRSGGLYSPVKDMVFLVGLEGEIREWLGKHTKVK